MNDEAHDIDLAPEAVAAALDNVLEPLTPEQQEADEAMLMRAFDELSKHESDMAAEWESQRDANLAIQRVDELELKCDELHMRVLALTHALHKIRHAVRKPMPAAWMTRQVEQLCSEVAV